MVRTFSPALETVKNARGNRPNILIQVHFASGTRYFADHSLTAAGQAYEALVSQVSSITLDMKTILHNMSFDLVNLDTTALSNQFLSDPPETTPVDVYLRFADAPDLVANFIPVFLGEIKGVKYTFNKVRIDLVERGEKLPDFPGTQITRTLLPEAAESDIGKILPIVYGDIKQSRAVLAVKLAETILGGAVSGTDTIFNVTDTTGFPLSGSGKINDEIFTYTNKNATQFLGITRGANVTHEAGSNIREVGEEVYVMAGHPSVSVLNVQAGGGPVVTPFVTSISDSGVIPGLDVTSIRFTDRPQGAVSGFGTSQVRIDWDTVSASNVATNPTNAFRNSGTFTALNHATVDGVTAGTRVLALERTSTISNLGTLEKAEVVCRFFTQNRVIAANGLFARIENTATATVQDLSTELGDATTPEANTVDVGGNINIDHAHGSRFQTVAIRPDSVFSSVGWNSPQNAIDGSNSIVALSDSSPPGVPPGDIVQFSLPTSINGSGDIVRFRVCSFSGGGKGYSVRLFDSGLGPVGLPSFHGDGVNDIVCGPYSSVPGVTFASLANPASRLSVAASSTSLVPGAPTISRLADVWLEVEYDTRPVDLSGEDPVLDTTPVYELRAEIDTALMPDVFGSIDDLKFSVGYGAGTTPRPEIYVFESFLDIAVGGSSGTVDSTEVTADIIGQRDDGAGTYTGTPLATIRQASDVIRHLIEVHGGLSTADIDLTAFASARASLASLSSTYFLEGVIRDTVRFGSILKVLGTNCRCDVVWEDGKARLLFRPTTVVPPTHHTFNKDNFFDTLEVSRVPMDEMINDISVQYQLLQDGSSGGYNKTLDAENAPSIALFRRRTKQIQLNFVVQDTAAFLNRSFYLTRRQNPKRLVTLRTPLDAIHLQRGDLVRVTEPRLDFNDTVFRIMKWELIPGRAINGTMDALRFELEEL